MNEELRMQNAESLGSGYCRRTTRSQHDPPFPHSAFRIPHFARRAARAAAVLLTLGAAGCTDWAGYDLDRFWGKIPFLAVLREDVSYDPYALPRLPADGTIPVVNPRGDVPPPFTQTDLVSGNLPPMSNPYQATEDVITYGNALYQRHCMACHGTQGQGNGPVIGPGKFPLGPSVITPVATAHSDAYLYGIIRVGRGLMPAYGDRMRHDDRWAVVTYLRALQRQNGQIPPVLLQPAEAIIEAAVQSPEEDR